MDQSFDVAVLVQAIKETVEAFEKTLSETDHTDVKILIERCLARLIEFLDRMSNAEHSQTKEREIVDNKVQEELSQLQAEFDALSIRVGHIRDQVPVEDAAKLNSQLKQMTEKTMTVDNPDAEDIEMDVPDNSETKELTSSMQKLQYDLSKVPDLTVEMEVTSDKTKQMVSALNDRATKPSLQTPRSSTCLTPKHRRFLANESQDMMVDSD